MKTWLVAVVGVVAMGCVERNGRYCGDGVCTDPAYPFCDIDGALGGDAKTCIAVACTPQAFTACRGDDAITCDGTGNNYVLVRCERGCDDQIGCKPPPDAPSSTVQVDASGSDANDGLTSPVRTLKRALGIAATDPRVTTIALAAGRYGAAEGETYPYTIPAGIILHGPAGGGAILVGTKSEPGLNVAAGAIRDVELEDFQVAVISRGDSELARLRVRDSSLAVRGETSARLTVSQLDITGPSGLCATGIELWGGATILVTDLATSGLGTGVASRDQSAATVVRASLTGAIGCTGRAFSISTSATLSISDSEIVGGGGVELRNAPTLTQVTISNTTFRDALLIGTTAKLTMTGGAIANAGIGLLGGGDWTFTNVAMTGPVGDAALYAQAFAGASTHLVMRGCTVSGDLGVSTSGAVIVDLGTVASPGNNVFTNNSYAGLGADSCGPRLDAVGNTWRAGVQGADGTGKYPVPAVVNGPLGGASGNNFAIASGCSLAR